MQDEADIERKRAEIRKRMEKYKRAKMENAKKGFMTPVRRKKLKVNTETFYYRHKLLCLQLHFGLQLFLRKKFAEAWKIKSEQLRGKLRDLTGSDEGNINWQEGYE